MGKSFPEITSDPVYDIPSGELLSSIPVMVDLRSKIEDDCMVGLKSFWIDAKYKNSDGELIKDSGFQKWHVRNGGRGMVPSTSPEDLTKIVWLRCRSYANEKRLRVSFRVWFYVEDANETPDRPSKSFTLDGEPDQIPESKMTIEPPPRIDTTGLRQISAGPILPNPDDERPRDRAAADLMPMSSPAVMLDSSTPPWVVTLVQQAMGSMSAVSERIAIQASALLEQSRNNHGKEIHDTSALARDVVERTGVAMSGVMSANAAAMQAIMDASTRNTQILIAGMQGVISDQGKASDRRVDTTMDVISLLSEELRASNKRAALAETRNSENRQDESEGSRRTAWAAFEHSMKMRLETEEIVRQRLAEEMAAAALDAPPPTEEPKKKSIGHKIYEDLKPLIPIGLSHLMQSLGNRDAAQASIRHAESLSSQEEGDGGDEDDEDDHEEDEEEIPQPDLSTIHGKLFAMVQILSKDQVSRLVQTIGQSSWDGIVAASQASSDDDAIPSLLPLAMQLRMKPDLEVQVKQILDPRQRTLLGGVVASLKAKFGGGDAKKAPSRPPSQPKG